MNFVTEKLRLLSVTLKRLKSPKMDEISEKLNTLKCQTL